MAQRVPFFHASRTVNEDLILQRLGRHGVLECHATELPLEPAYTSSDRVPCYLADVMALFSGRRGYVLVGIEVKDWEASVHTKLARGYLAAYGRVCQYVYLAANDFSQDLFGVRDLGLFHLGRRQVVKAPALLSPDPGLWRSAALRLAEECGRDLRLPRHPGQTVLGALF